jgi:hypothetical protein
MPKTTDEVPISHLQRRKMASIPDMKLTHTQTVMEGASHCEFRFTAK